MSEKGEDGKFESSPDSREDYKSNKIGPTITQNAPALGGPREDLDWTFSAGVFSDVSQSRNHDDSGVVDDAFEADLVESSPSKPSTITKGKKGKKKGKKVKKKKKGGKTSKTNKPALDFHTRNPTISNSSVPGGASEISMPRYRKNTPHKNHKSASQDRSSKNYASGSYDHEGGSRGTFTNNRSSQNEQFWSPSPRNGRRVGLFGPERTYHRPSRNRDAVTHLNSPFHRECSKHNSSSPSGSKSVPRTDGFRN